MSLQYLSDKEAAQSQAHSSPVVSVCWLPSSSITAPTSTVLSGDCEGVLKAWDAASARAYKSLPRAHKTAIHCISTNHSGTTVLTTAIDGSLALWDMSVFQRAEAVDDTAVEGQDQPLLPLPIESHAELMVARLDSILNAASSHKISESWKTVLHPTLPVFVSVGAGANVTLHSTGVGSSEAFGTILAESVARTSHKDLFGISVALDTEGRLLAVGCNTGQVMLYKIGENTIDFVTEFADHPSAVRALSFSPGHLYAGGDDRILTIYDIRSLQTASSPHSSLGGTVAALTGHKGWIIATAPVPSTSRVVASLSMDKTVKFWDLDVNPKSCICTCSEVDTIRSFCFQQAPTTPTATTTSVVGGFGQSSRFVTASNDGKLRWYRSAGI